MNISSVVIQSHPERVAEVQAALLAIPGVEIHAVTEAFRIAATLEDTSTSRAADTYVALHDLPGVLTVTLIYQYDDADEGVAIPPGLLDSINVATAAPGQTTTH
jgi:nitrate reductase NapD